MCLRQNTDHLAACPQEVCWGVACRLCALLVACVRCLSPGGIAVCVACRLGALLVHRRRVGVLLVACVCCLSPVFHRTCVGVLLVACVRCLSPVCVACRLCALLVACVRCLSPVCVACRLCACVVCIAACRLSVFSPPPPELCHACGCCGQGSTENMLRYGVYHLAGMIVYVGSERLWDAAVKYVHGW